MSVVEECATPLDEEVLQSDSSSSLSSFEIESCNSDDEPRGPYYMIEISGLARKMLTKIKLFLQDKNSAEAKFEMKPQVIPDMLITDNLCLNPKIVYAL